MSHLNDKLAEFFYGELSTSEMNESRRHLSECHDCRTQFEQFERTHHVLKALPEVNPPQQTVFAVEKRPASVGWISRWLAPMTASAAVALAVVTFVPNRAVQESPAAVPVMVQQPVTERPVAQPVDYEQIMRELRDSDRAWIIAELARRDASREKELQRIRAELAYYDDLQRAMWKDTFENTASIQLLAQRSGSRE